MGIYTNIGSNSKKIYKSALTGAYFGILNVFLVFIPFLNSIFNDKILFFTYLVTGIIMLTGVLIVPLCYRNKYSYSIAKLRYLLYLGSCNLAFYVGLLLRLFLNFGKTPVNLYILLLYAVLILMSVFDIFLSAKKGFKKIRRFYTRTYKKLYQINIFIILGGILTGVVLLLLLYIK